MRQHAQTESPLAVFQDGGGGIDADGGFYFFLVFGWGGWLA